MQYDQKLFEAFFALLPHDSGAAIAMAKRHSLEKTRVWLETDKERPVRHAVEIRHESFRAESFIKMLRRFNVALVCADTVEWPRLMDITSNFVYCRLHGSEQLYASGYGAKALDDWEKRVRAWAAGEEPADAERICGPGKPRKSGRDVFLYFDNDIKVKAPENAAGLAKRLELAASPESAPAI